MLIDKFILLLDNKQKMNKRILLVLLFFSTVLAWCNVQLGSDITNWLSQWRWTKISIFLDDKINNEIIWKDKQVLLNKELINNNEEIWNTLFMNENNRQECKSNNFEIDIKTTWDLRTYNESNNIYDITLDLTYFMYWNKNKDLANIPTQRIDRLMNYLRGNEDNKIKLELWDKIILRFLWTIGYGDINIPLNEKIEIFYQNDSTESFEVKESIIKWHCEYNRATNEFYLKINSSDIQEDAKVYEEKKINSNFDNMVFDDLKSFSLDIWKNKKYRTTDFKELKEIISKEFKARFDTWNYSKWTYIIEYIDNSDIMEHKDIENTTTLIFSDWEFQLHPTFAKELNIESDINKFNFSAVSLNEQWDKLRDFYDDLLLNEYLANIENNKCLDFENVYIIWVRDSLNSNFYKLAKNFYSELLPNCNVKVK